jgi:hypothetical protein
MGAATKTLYETDFAECCTRTADLVRAGRLDEVDLEHVAEEIEDMGKRGGDEPFGRPARHVSVDDSADPGHAVLPRFAGINRK